MNNISYATKSTKIGDNLVIWNLVIRLKMMALEGPKKKIKEIEPATIQSLMEGVRSRIDQVRRWRVIEKRN